MSEPLAPASDDAEQPSEIERLAAAQDQEIDDFPWGGDGSNLSEPVRAHVEAALAPTDAPYPPPVDQLLSIGELRDPAQVAGRLSALGLSQQHVPDLVRMARDRALNTAPSESDAVWAPIHAIAALSELDVSDHVEDLIPLFDTEDDTFLEELPGILGSAGAPAIEPLAGYLHDRGRWVYGRAAAGRALTAIGMQHPELRDQAVAILADEMEHASANLPELNGFLLAELIELDAVEALPAIRRAFEQNLIDESVAGDWAEVLGSLDQEVDDSDPLVRRSRERWENQIAAQRAELPGFGGLAPAPSSAPRRSKDKKASKQKSKRKMASASRKANKKKKRK